MTTPTFTEDSLKNLTVEGLAQLWLDTKASQKAAAKNLLAVEQAMMPLLEVPEEGSKTNNANGFKIVAKGVINRTLDVKEWEAIREEIPETLRPIKYTPKLDEVGVKWLRDNNMEIYNKISQCITSKPGKTNITVTKEEE